ncbi:MAG TPA: cytochrome c biogenesis protein CcsA [Verrucomicrobiae bacterium]|jgi:hypothetical protein|nr:cytochrome c biogenesis protein CcsA [Verrucomicrobiae bacterium]
MHEIERSIQEWRKKLAAQLGRERLEEIEGHFREAIDAELRQGLSEAEAFQIALQRVGRPEDITVEFQKLQPSMWWPARLAIIFGVVASISLGAWLIIRLAAGPANYLLAAHVFTSAMGYGATFLLGALGTCYVLQRSFGELPPDRMRSLNQICAGFAAFAAILTGVGVLLGMVWTKQNWGWVWSWDPKELGGAATLVWLLCLTVSARGELAPAHVIMLANLLGNILVGFAWFGPGMNLPGTLIFIILSSLAFFCLGLAPAGWLHRRIED